MERARVWVATVALCFGACAKSEVPEQSELEAACFSGVELEAWSEKFARFEWCAIEIDRGVDGDIDARREQVYDADGQLTWRVQEAGEETRLEYDELGRITLIELFDGEGEPLWTERRVYEGRSGRIERDFEADGEIDVLQHDDYSCFPEEDEWPLPGACTSSIDIDADGEIDDVTQYEYEDGLIRSSLATRADSEPLRTTYSYDDDGEITGIDYDKGDDGTIDRLYRVEQVDARTTISWDDFDGDGERDTWLESITDEEGNPLTESMFQEDGELFWRIETVRERGGLLVRETTTYPEQPEEDSIVEARYDSAGNVVGVAIDKHPLGSPDECNYVSYACLER